MKPLIADLNAILGLSSGCLPLIAFSVNLSALKTGLNPAEPLNVPADPSPTLTRVASKAEPLTAPHLQELQVVFS